MNQSVSTTPEDVLEFWFSTLEPKQWWVKDSKLDDTIRDKFENTLYAASRGELFAWRNTAEGRLAEIIVLDQFSRNLHRGSAQAFANDAMALALCQEAITLGLDKTLAPIKRGFLYMPLMHSESLIIHEWALEKFSQDGLEANLKAEHAHLNILKQFNRYPHRNEALGRQSTEEEIAFLKTEGSSF